MSEPRRASRRPHLVLVPKAPRVYVGPNAERSLRGERGVLLGARRYAWVDVFEFDPRPRAPLRRLVDLRFSDSGPWDVVGLSLSTSDLKRSEAHLLRDLVPGDVLLTENGPRVHTGAAFVKTKLAAERKKIST
ncbi:MAG: hypothetical protein ACRD21_22520 [Vicinamibacteria bacterium]